MANKPKEAQPINREGYWYLVRRVPKRLAVLEGRSTVAWSTGIPVWQDPRAIRATVLVRQYDNDLQEHWNQLLTGTQSQWPREHRKNVEHAASLQLSYASNAALATGSLEDLLQRFSILVGAWGEKALVEGSYSPALRADVAATLGRTEEPDEQDTADGVMASQMLEEYVQVKATELARKSPRQLSKWRVRRQSALDLFITVIGGDKPFKKLSRKDVQTFRKYWQQRIEKGEVRINSANRNVRQVSGLYSVVKDFHQVEGQNIFERIRIPGGEEGKRIPFDADFVQKHYLCEGQFRDINPEARRIIYLCIETGVRLSEACALDRTTIHLHWPAPWNDTRL